MMTAISRAKITMNAMAVGFNILRLNFKINYIIELSVSTILKVYSLQIYKKANKSI